MSSLRRSRTLASFGVVVGAVALLYTFALLLGMDDPDWAYLARGPMHLGELAAVLALALSAAAGRSRLAWTGLGAAAAGCLLLAVAEVLSESSSQVSGALFGLGPTLVGIGLLLAGVAVLRTGSWTGWHRYVPLGLGIYVFTVLTPVLIASGGPPATASLWALSGWQVLWVLVAVAVLVETAAAPRRAAPALA